MSTMPSVMIDPTTGVFSVDLAHGQVARTVEFDDSHLVDLDADGQVLSLEVLTPSDPKIDEMAAAFGFEDRVPDIREVVDLALSPHTTTTTPDRWRIERGVVAVVAGEVAETRPAPQQPEFSLQ